MKSNLLTIYRIRSEIFMTYFSNKYGTTNTWYDKIYQYYQTMDNKYFYRNYFKLKKVTKW